MADSNASRARRRELHVYLTPEDDAELRRVAEQIGETVQTIARRGIRREVKRAAAEAAKGQK